MKNLKLYPQWYLYIFNNISLFNYYISQRINYTKIILYVWKKNLNNFFTNFDYIQNHIVTNHVYITYALQHNYSSTVLCKSHWVEFEWLPITRMTKLLCFILIKLNVYNKFVWQLVSYRVA